MSVLIKGLEMPKGCASCFLKYGSCASIRKRMDVSKGDRWCPENYRHPDCPIIEIPQHGRLIDADELMRRIQLYIDEYELYVDENGFHCEKWCAMKETEMAINDAPTVIPADNDGET